MNYKPRLNNQVLNALFRCIEEDLKEAEVHEKILTFESDAVMELDRSQKSKGKKSNLEKN